MFDAIIRGTLGELGSAILDFYIKNQLWINGIIIFYALVLVLAKRGYSAITDALKTEILRKHGEDFFAKSERNFKKSYNKIDFDWDSIAKQTYMPIVSAKGSLIFQIKSISVLKKHFTPEKVYEIFKNKKDKLGE